MDLARAKLAYGYQKGGAKHRGIAWELTFDQWLEWWGSDLDRRGVGVDSLQMQRPNDSGPYAIGNIYKGTPKQNMQTKGNMQRNRSADRQKRKHQEYLDSLMWAPSKEARDEIYSKDEIERLRMYGAFTSCSVGSSFPAEIYRANR